MTSRDQKEDAAKPQGPEADVPASSDAAAPDPAPTDPPSEAPAAREILQPPAPSQLPPEWETASDLAQPPAPGAGLAPEDDDRTVIAQPPVFSAEQSAPPKPSAPVAPNAETGAATDAEPEAGADVGTPDMPPVSQSPASQSPASQSTPPAPIPKPSSGSITKPGKLRTITIGTLINNNYEVTDILKAGGMGEVYRGIELGTGDPVAIKSILQERAEDEKAALMFRREARTLRQLSDPAIVRYYNYVHDLELDRYFLVMEFIEGLTLSEHLKEHGPVPVPSCRTLLKRLATGLGKAHAHGVIHRDLSPDNVMLPGGAMEDARLIDFGIARSNVLKEGTMAGVFAGKFKYVAPEQLGHFDGHIGPATDVYGLGLLMAAAASGASLDMGRSIVEAVEARRQIPDLSAVPDDLRPLVSFMLEPDPADRPASMDEVLRMLNMPQMIPEQYGGGSHPVQVETAAPQPTTPPEGLQVPSVEGFSTGLTTPPRTTPPRTTPPAFVTSSITTPPVTPRTTPPQTLSPSPRLSAAAPKVDRSGAWLLLAFFVVFAGLLGFAGYYAWKNDLITFLNPSAPEKTPTEEPTQTTPPVTPATPAAQPGSREDFLKTFAADPCTYVTRVALGPNTGVIEGFSATDNRFTELPAAYEKAFGSQPEVFPRKVDEPQCPVLDFARALQAQVSTPVRMLVSPDEVKSGESLQAEISVSGNQSVWVALISPRGGIYNLTGQLSDAIGGKRTLTFGLNLSDEAESSPQLILAVASDKPLANAAAARDGARASELLPLIQQELSKRGDKASAALSYVLLTR